MSAPQTRLVPIASPAATRAAAIRAGTHRAASAPPSRYGLSGGATARRQRPVQAGAGDPHGQRDPPGGHVPALVQLPGRRELVRADRRPPRRQRAAAPGPGGGQPVPGPLGDQVVLNYVDRANRSVDEKLGVAAGRRAGIQAGFSGCPSRCRAASHLVGTCRGQVFGFPSVPIAIARPSVGQRQTAASSLRSGLSVHSPA